MSAVTTARARARRPGLTPGATGMYLLLGALAIIYVYPFLVQVATSFKTDADAASSPLSLLPST